MEVAGRDVERSLLVQIGAGTGSILVFLALVTFVGLRWAEEAPGSTNSIDLDPTGGLMLVVALAVFVVFMSVVGLALSDELSDEDD